MAVFFVHSVYQYQFHRPSTVFDIDDRTALFLHTIATQRPERVRGDKCPRNRELLVAGALASQPLPQKVTS